MSVPALLATQSDDPKAQIPLAAELPPIDKENFVGDPAGVTFHIASPPSVTHMLPSVPAHRPIGPEPVKVNLVCATRHLRNLELSKFPESIVKKSLTSIEFMMLIVKIMKKHR